MGIFDRADKKYAPQLMQILDQLMLKIEELILIGELTEAQPELMQADEVEALMDNIAQRQGAIDRIDAIDARIAQMSHAFNLPERVNDPEDIAVMQKVLDANTQMEALLQKITRQDAQNARLAQSRLELYQKGLKQANEGLRGIAGYSSAPIQEEGIYFDQKK